MVNAANTGLSSSPERASLLHSLPCLEMVRQLRRKHAPRYIARVLGEVYNDALDRIDEPGVTEEDIRNLPELG